MNFALDIASVYLTYEFQPAQSSSAALPNEIRLARSHDQASTFSTPMVVSTNASLNALPHVAVDPSISNSFGTVYLAWSGSSASNNSTEVLVSDSVDQGASFSFPRPISPTPPGVQSSPVLEVDTAATVAVCFYSTPARAPISAYSCATSSNLGATWQTQRLATPALVGFDALAGDSQFLSTGFFTAFEVNSNGARTVVGSSNPQ